MSPVTAPPSAIANLFTFGVARARWISQTNTTLGHSTGFLFAWLLQAFANYGLAERFNAALASKGSSHTVSPIVCFLFTGWPFFGAVAQFRNGVKALNAAQGAVPAAA